MPDIRRSDSDLVVKVVYQDGYDGLAAAICSLFNPESSSVRSDSKTRPITVGNALVIIGDSPDMFRAVLSQKSVPPTLVLGPTNDTDIMLEVIEDGATGYLSNGASLDMVTDSIRSVAGGTAVLPPIMLGVLARQSVQRERRRKRIRAQLNELTPRQREVFFEAAKGHDKHRIAAALSISPETARTHVYNVMTTLGLHSRNELISLAYELHDEEVDA